MKIKNLLTPFILVFITTNMLAQEDLILDGQDTTLFGEHTFKNITLTNNSTILVGGDGELTLYADSIFIDVTSKINADGVSSGGLGNGGNGSSCDNNSSKHGGGGGGAGYGESGLMGNNGTWVCANGGQNGSLYGSNILVEKGSKGGNGSPSDLYLSDGHGGTGGGKLIILCKYIDLDGIISANGNNGNAGGYYHGYHPNEHWVYGGGGGGGSGGGILINSHYLDGSGEIYSTGGDGGGGWYPGGNGGKGSGGRITIVSLEYNTSISVDNGVFINFTTVPPYLSLQSHTNSNFYYNNTNFIIEWEPLSSSLFAGYLFLFDDNKYTIPTAGTGIATSDTSATFSDLSQGTYYFHIVAVKNTGEIGQIANHYQGNINTSPPNIITSSTHPIPDTWMAINYNFQFSWDTEFVLNDDESFAGYWYAINQDSVTIPTTSDNFVADNEINLDTTIGDGTWYFHVLSEDTEGNLTEEAGHYQFKVDAQPSYIKWSYPENNSWGVPPDTSIAICLTDDGIGIDTSTVILPRLSMSINSEIVAPDSIVGTPGEYVIYYKPNQSFSVPEIVTVEIESQDLMTPIPHTMTASFSFTTELDVNPPYINQVIPENGIISSNPLQAITLTIMDISPFGIVEAELNETQISFIVNGKEYNMGNDQLSWNIPYLEFQPSDIYPEGETTIALSGLSDTSGNIMSDSSWVITVDLSPPIVSNSQPVNGTTISELQPEISVKIIDNVGYIDEESIQLTIQGISYTTSNNALTWNSSDSTLRFIPESFDDGAVDVSLAVSDHVDYGEVHTTQYDWSFNISLIGQLVANLKTWDNTGISNALVKIFHNGELIIDTLTNSAGSINFGDLPIGDYTLTVEKQGYFYYRKDIQVNLNEVTGLEIFLSFPGDYDVDGDIDFDDLSDFATAWHSDDSSIEFGPTTGTVPDLTVQPDGVLNFEDLMIFTLMWNWWYENNPDALTRTIWSDEKIGPAYATLSQKMFKDGSFVYQVITKHLTDFKASQVIINYNPVELTFKGVQVGGLFVDSNPLLLKVLDEESGLLEIGLIHFGEKEIQESGVLAEVEFQHLSVPITNIEYFYDLRSRDGSVSEGTGVWEAPLIPDDYSLSQNYPNPFNPVTTINFSLPIDAKVSLNIYNLQGREVKSLVEGDMNAGYHSIVWHANDFSTGIYCIRLNSQDFASTKKMILLK